MKKSVRLSLVLLAVPLLAVVALTASRLSGLGSGYVTYEVDRGSLVSWVTYEGTVKARSVTTIMSQLSGSAVLTSLAPEGTRVSEGDVLVTLDTAALEKELLGLRRDADLAEAERDNLADALQPLQLRELELKLSEADGAYTDEKTFLGDSRELAGEGLVSPFEVRQQEGKTEQARLRYETYALELGLTTNVVHPSERRRAEARAEAARETLALVRKQLASCLVRAPSDGAVVYLPLHVAGEFRTVRVGDAVFKNQPFLALHDMRELVVHIEVPESELSSLDVGREAVVTPLAYPDLPLTGEVLSIGSVARTLPGEPSWKKFFHVTLKLHEADARLRSGMSVHSRILSHHRGDAVRVPRVAVWWENDTPYCSVVERGRARVRRLELGISDAEHFEVVEGLTAGERVRMP